jgi:hypothetical protein
VDRSLRDIADAIGMIETFTAGMDFEAFRGDPKTLPLLNASCKSSARRRSVSGATPKPVAPAYPGGTFGASATGCVTSTSGLNCR